LRAGYAGRRAGSTAAEAEIRQFGAPGRNAWRCPARSPQAGGKGWLHPEPGSTSLRPGTLQTGGKWELWFGFPAPSAPGLQRSRAVAT